MDRTLLIGLAMLVIIFTLGHMSRASPSYSAGWSNYRNRLDEDSSHVNECETSNVSRELCQRCAKVTKSRLAYTMCCERRENTREWCIKFLNFGITSASSSTANTNNS